MNSEPTPSDREVLTGLVERVTYQNAENGFCILRVKARGRHELVTLVGHAAAIFGRWPHEAPPHKLLLGHVHAAMPLSASPQVSRIS
jgi:hypothetical protein